MRVRHPWRLLVTGVVGVVLVLAVYAGWLAWRAEKGLTAAADDARALKAAVQADDPGAVRAAATKFAADAHRAHSAPSNPVWRLVTYVPWLGGDARGVDVVAQVADGLGSGGLADLASSASKMQELLPHHGTIGVPALTQLQAPVSRGAADMQRASAALHAVDPSGYVAALRTRYLDLESQVDQAAGALGTADRALQVLPTMLGQDHPKNYLLVVYNNAEIRSGGGLPGAVSLLHAENGHISITKQAAGGAMVTEKPVLPLTTPEQVLFGPQLGDYFVDANFTPDFDRTADLMRAQWQRAHGDRADGVIVLDPVTLSYLLQATGPVTVDGHQIDADNAVSYLLHQIYLDYRNPAAQDAFFAKVAQQVFASVTGGGGNPQSVLRAFARGASERRLLVHSFDPSVQTEIAGTQVAGELPSAPTTPEGGLYLDDTTASKLSYYMRYDTQVASTSCSDGVQGISAHATVRSVAPQNVASQPTYISGTGAYGVPRGWELVTAYVFAPVDGSIQRFTVDGVKQQYDHVQYDGRPVAMTYLWLKPGRSFKLAWTMKSGPGQTGDVQLQMTPSVVPGGSATWARTSCS